MSLSDDDLALLAALAAGALPPDEAQAAERRAAASPELARELRRLRTTLALLPPGPLPRPPSRPRSLLLAHLDGSDPFAGFVDRFCRIFQVPADEARRTLSPIPSASWEPFLPGVTLRHFSPGPALRGEGVDAGLVRLEPGTTFPHHDHGGDETTLVLQGGFVDSLTGRHVQAGDTLRLPAGSAHDFRIDRDGVCISAVLLLGPIKLTRG